MRKYNNDDKMQLEEVICNKCGRLLKVENGIIKEGCFSADTVFGYFSEKDGNRHLFDLCEKCYDHMIQEFSVPICEIEEKELC
mgnify:CR=1 FL=1